MSMSLDHRLVAADAGQVADGQAGRPDPEEPERARQRSFTASYKREILAAYDAAGPGEKGAILRREGLYSSHIVEWRQARDAGALAGLASTQRPSGSQLGEWWSPNGPQATSGLDQCSPITCGSFVGTAGFEPATP